jgi:hypothetical protein
MTRRLTADGEAGRKYFSSDYKDTTKLSGLTAALSASARFLEKTPLTLRMWVGVARLTAKTGNEGTFTGDVSGTAASGVTETATVSQRVSIPEQNATLWAPFLGPEVRFGYRISKAFSVDVGVAGWLMFASQADRVGTSALGATRRAVVLDPVPRGFPSGAAVVPGVMQLPQEKAAGTTFVVLPTVGARFDF